MTSTAGGDMANGDRSTEAAAKQAVVLYRELREIDGLLAAMRAGPLQNVTFYLSGPTDYEPRHLSKAIAACIISDMEMQRAIIAGRIEALGFVPTTAVSDHQTGASGNTGDQR